LLQIKWEITDIKGMAMEPKRTTLLKDAFNLEKGGVVCLVGAGGKTSLMFKMARALSDAGVPVLTTTTTHIMEPTVGQSPYVIVSASLDSILKEAESRLKETLHISAAFSRTRTNPGKLAGFPPGFIDELFVSGLFRWILVEADGSAGRPLKAPAAHEPVIPDGTGWIIGVAGLRGVGKPLREDRVFRSGLYAGITGLEPGSPVTESSVALSITHKNGILKGGPAGSRRYVFLNLSDEPDQLEAGRRIARLLDEHTRPRLERVVIGKTLQDPPIVEYYELDHKEGNMSGHYKNARVGLTSAEHKLPEGTQIEQILGSLQEGKKVLLARIIRQEGSTPRDVGTRCLILEDGTLMGTIGGGLVEHRVQEKAKALFQTGLSEIIRFELAGNDAAENEMLCGGSVDVYLEPLFPENSTTLRLFERCHAMIEKGSHGAMLTMVSEGIGYRDESCRLLVEEDGTMTGGIGALSIEKTGVTKIDLKKFLGTERPVLVEIGENRGQVFVEPVRPFDALFLFGAGHISRVLAGLACMVGFRVVVIDDRCEFANKERFPAAAEIHVTPFAESFNRIRVNASSYITIITRGHNHDLEVLRESLKTNSAYIGMIGSRRKRDVIYRSLIQEGAAKERLDKVHSPIGLDIGAETPEEIAVSIIAELIHARASKPVTQPAG
jgi:xanthine dehydrogenase accessory factor